MRKLWLKSADVAGTTLRGLVATWAGLAGAVCVCVGLGLIYLPLAVLSAGVFLLIIDARRP